MRLKDAIENAFSGRAKALETQIGDMLRSKIPEERELVREALADRALNGGSRIAKDILLAHCTRVLDSPEQKERSHSRMILAQLAASGDCPKARDALEAAHRGAIADFDLPALIYLGMNGRPEIGKAVDAALEAGFERITGREGLDAMAYIAGMSCCSREKKRKAAEIAAESEQRVGNLECVYRASSDSVVRNLMRQAIERLS